MSEAINRVLKESKVLDLKDLCIEEGKAVWVLYVDAVCVSYDGNIYDAALAAIMAALNNGKQKKKDDRILDPLKEMFNFHCIKLIKLLTLSAILIA